MRPHRTLGETKSAHNLFHAIGREVLSEYGACEETKKHDANHSIHHSPQRCPAVLLVVLLENDAFAIEPSGFERRTDLVDHLLQAAHIHIDVAAFADAFRKVLLDAALSAGPGGVRAGESREEDEI